MASSSAPPADSSVVSSTVSPARDETLLGLPLPPELVERGRCPFDPPVGLDRMREQSTVSPVALLNGHTVWVVTGFDQARAVLSDRRFSADRFRHGSLLSDVSEEVRKQLLDERWRAGSFLFMDPPQHSRYRKLLTGKFTVRRMRQLTPRIMEIVTEHIDAMLAAGTSAELVSAFALPVPSLVICELLGVPYANRREFQQRTAMILRLDTSLEDFVRVRADMRQFMRLLVTDKRDHPTDDLLSELVHSDADPALTDDELVNIANLLLVAGHETTANMLALGIFALLEHPNQLHALRADPSLIDGAVEELLRYLSIVHLGLTRVALEPVQFAGQEIPAGATVLISLPETNRDPEHWANPGCLDVTRARSPHLAFGHGVHQCLGQQLARVEMTVGFTELLHRLPGLRLAIPPQDVPLRSDMLIFGVHALPVHWDNFRAPR
jgi:cytochrome P450